MKKLLTALFLFSIGSFAIGQVVKQNTGSANVGSATGTLPVGNGGTGATSLTQNAVLYGNGTSAVSASGNVSIASNGAMTVNRSSLTVTNGIMGSTLTLTEQPFMKVGLAVTQAVADNSLQAVYWDTVIISTGAAMWVVGSSSTFTINEAGFYGAVCSISWPTNATGSRTTRIYAGGGAVGTSVLPALAGAKNQQATAFAYLSAGQSVECDVLQDSGGPLNIQQGTAINANMVLFKLY